MMWCWFNNILNQWIDLPEDIVALIESEYIAHQTNTRVGQYVYHCFGNHWSTCINFDTMKTYCSSAKCMLLHEANDLPDDHLTFRLKRK